MFASGIAYLVENSDVNIMLAMWINLNGERHRRKVDRAHTGTYPPERM